MFVKRNALCIVNVVAMVILAQGAGHGAVLRVREGASIQGALATAAAGDTVLLSGVDYFENIVVSTPVVLKGEDGATVRGGYQGNVVHVLASGTVLDGLRLSESGSSLSKDMACILIEADRVTVRNCRVSRALHGIYVKAGSGAHISGNRIEGRSDLVEADRGNGIHLWNSRDNRIEHNEIVGVRDGIYFSFADSTSVEGNRIHHSRYGLHYMYSNHNRFLDNTFEDNVAGAALMYSHDILVQRNVFARNRGFRAYGILYQSMDSTLAEENLILDNSRGIFLNNSSHHTFSSNDVVDNDLAVQLNGGCDDNSFIQNNFINNLSDLILDVGDQTTMWNRPERGNHWSAYRGYDLTGDGNGDVPHNIQRIFQIMETETPEVRFYLFSPAAEILEEAELALPILDFSNARDHQPAIRPARDSEVPLVRAGGLQPRGGGALAVLYLLCALLPLLLLMQWGKGQRRHRPPQGGSLGGH